jgi:hypothetical protein
LSVTVGAASASRFVVARMSRSPTETVGIVMVNDVVGLPPGTAEPTNEIATSDLR